MRVRRIPTYRLYRVYDERILVEDQFSVHSFRIWYSFTRPGTCIGLHWGQERRILFLVGSNCKSLHTRMETADRVKK